MISFNSAPEITWCKIIETTLHTTITLWAGTLIRINRRRAVAQSDSFLETLRVQCGEEDGVGRKNSGSIAYRATFGLESNGVGGIRVV